LAKNPEERKLKIIIADDHPLFLEGLKTVLALEDDLIEAVGVAENGREAVEITERTGPDVALLDIKMPVMDGIEAARLIRARCPAVKIVMLTTFDDQDLIGAALKAGAHGYILKDARPAEIVQTIKLVHEGKLLMSPSVVESFQRSMAAPERNAMLQEAIPDFDVLSRREREILSLMLRDMDNLGIAAELGISEKTVRNHVSQIYDVLGIHDRRTLLNLARLKGI
jgi:DNA-binding NarL/FixJ family response regulator